MGCFFGLGFESCLGLRLFLWALAAAHSKWGAESEFWMFSSVSAEFLCLSAFFGMLLEKPANHAEKSGFIAR